MARERAAKASPQRTRRQAEGQRDRFDVADGVDGLCAIATALTAELSAANERLRSL
jgi:hypothetical protein